MNDAKTDPKQIFLDALECPSPEERAQFLEQACAGDEGVRARVEHLLAAHQEAGNFLCGSSSHPSPIESMEHPGMVIGHYKLLEQIGEGGFGVVFLAEQERPVRRKVALKIIKPGMDTRQVIARFEVERQALALMDHPNIAKVLDAGATGEGVRFQVSGVSEDRAPFPPTPDTQHLTPNYGRPYFVMELVRGVPITEYCDQCNLSTRERLELFITVCQAVQHAHQKGIIHRDLKPTNILVAMQDDKAAPKIIDFGVAKAINQQLTEHTLLTAFAQMVGTPLYMSPEQAELSPLGVDTRSDIYSLGVLLYELLTGCTPFDKDRLHAASYDEMRRIIREEEPPRPSARISTLAADLATTVAEQRRCDPRRLQQSIRGELDWIVMKCLEKDRSRRYDSAGSLARDIERYLHDEPVSAAAPSRLYRTGKFVRRNKWPVVASAAVLMGLLAGIIGTTIGLVSQSRQRAIAERERATGQVNVAIALQAQRRYAEAVTLLRQELANASGTTAADRQRAALMRLRLAEAVEDAQGPAASERLFHEALEAYRTAFPPFDTNIAHALNELAFLLRTQQRFEEVVPLFREVYEIHHRAMPADHRAIGESAANLANVLNTLGKYTEAEPIAREAVEEHRLAVPNDVWALGWARLELGRVLLAMGKFTEAEAELLAAERFLASTDHFLQGSVALAALYTAWNQVEPDRGFDAKAGEWVHRLIGTFVGPKVASIPAITIRAYDQPGDRPSAEELRRFRGKAANQTGSRLHSPAETRDIINQIDLLLAQKKPLAAAALLDSIAPEITPGRDSAGVFRTLGDWHVYHHGDWPQATARFRMLVQNDNLDPPDVVALDYCRFAAVLVELGETSNYDRMREDVIARFSETPHAVAAERVLRACTLLPANQKTIDSLVRFREVANDSRNPWAYTALAMLDYRRGDFGLAEDWCRKALTNPLYFGDAERNAMTRAVLAMALHQFGKKDEAQLSYREARKAIDEEFSKGFGGYVWFDWVIARILVRQANELIFDRGTTTP